VSGGTALAVVLSIVAGLAGPVQIAVMGRFGEEVGVFAALAFSLFLSTLLASLGLLVATRSVGGFADAATVPKWLWIGGVMGLVIVLSITFAGPRIGTAATIGILVAGNLAGGAVIDRYGWFGLDEVPLTWPRVLGIVLLAAGAALSLHRAA
jgi:transporter family-2 protein